jgi:hypothetical protein
MATARDEVYAVLRLANEPQAEAERLLDAYRAEVRRAALAEAEAKARAVVAQMWGGGLTQTQLDRTDGARAVEWEIGQLAATPTAPSNSGGGA